MYLIYERHSVQKQKIKLSKQKMEYTVHNNKK